MVLLRTYRQIAKILARREHYPTSPERVAQICRAAEMKIVYSLVQDNLASRKRQRYGAAQSLRQRNLSNGPYKARIALPYAKIAPVSSVTSILPISGV